MRDRTSKTHEEFLNECEFMINQGYKVLSRYENNKTPIEFMCPKGHNFTRLSKDFIRYKSCPKCTGKQKITIKDFKELIKTEANNEYLILEKSIANVHTPIILKHKVCGTEYPVSYTNFQIGKRCPECAKQNLINVCKENSKNNIKPDSEFRQEIFNLVGDEYTFLEPYTGKRNEILCQHNECKNQFKIKPDYFKSTVKRGFSPCKQCKVVKDRSKAEDEIFSFLKSFYNKKIILNDRTVLNGLELDFYLPEDNLAIEYNNLYWHSEEGSNGKCNHNYHYNKTNSCLNKGIRLIQIFENDWDNRKDIIKSKIKYILNASTDLPKIYARKCTIKVISSDLKNKFLDKHHIQGADRTTTVNLGLYYRHYIPSKQKEMNQLIAVMTFLRTNNNCNEYNLSRYASDNRFILEGGFTKLLKYFTRNYRYDSIITYADRTWSVGNLYEKNDFVFDGEVSPDYKYYMRGENQLYHKFGFRKDKIKKMFPDIYDDSKTEKQMMQEAGYMRVWNCGLTKYRYIHQ